jgi:A/G-specific adenine glycosylase
MTEVPSTAWMVAFDEDDVLAAAPLKAKWRKLPGAVEHGFTHFPLRQSVYVASVPAKTKAPEGMRWVARAELGSEALPNVFRKVATHAGLLAPPAEK